MFSASAMPDAAGNNSIVESQATMVYVIAGWAVHQNSRKPGRWYD